MASNGLITDLYQLTMANALFKKGMHERKVVFDRFYRKNPFDGGYTVVAGIQHLVDFVKNFRYDAEDIEYLRSLGIFYPEFLDYLKDFRFHGDIYAMPEGTVNAIGLVVNYLLDNGLCNETERAYLEAVRKLHASTAGEGLGINCADGPFGPLTVIGGRIYMEDGRIFQTMDSRFPTCTNGKKMTEQIRAALGDGAELRDVTAAEPFYIEADSPAILACINTYNEVTGENAKPFTMGGGTYARHFPYAVSFGPEHVDLPLPEFGGPMHGANEAAPIDKLLEAVKIYIIALLRLEEIDF